MPGIDAKHLFELAAAEDQQPVEALATHAADPALRVGVGVSAPDSVCGSRGSLRFGRPDPIYELASPSGHEPNF
jgi:hypothetical protein